MLFCSIVCDFIYLNSLQLFLFLETKHNVWFNSNVATLFYFIRELRTSVKTQKNVLLKCYKPALVQYLVKS